MASVKGDVTATDVSKLIADIDVDQRAETVGKVAQIFDDSLSEQDKRVAEDVFRTMLRDAEVRVRQALADSLKQNPYVPRDVAVGLARDVADVATPMLRHSEVLTDSDLIEIVQSQSADHQIAVASRDSVSASVADALVESDDETVVATLVGNDGADLSEGTLQKVVDAFGESEAVNAPMTLSATSTNPTSTSPRRFS